MPPCSRARSTCNSASLIVPFKPSSKRSLKWPGSLEPILIQDQGLGQRADLEQAMPLRGIAGQPRHLQAKYDADLAHADRGHQLLEALAVGSSPRLAEVTTTRSRGQPRATARSLSAYWRLVLSVFSKTWRRVLWRM